MATMRALVLDQWGQPPVLREVPVPAPRAGEVLVRVRACGVGLTVVNIMNGDLSNSDPALLPRIPGHEVAGEIAALGPNVTGLQEGDRVITHFYLTCGHCTMCRQGRENLCQNFRGFLGAQCDGGYADYICLPARNCFRIPDRLGYIPATVIPDAVLTPLHISRSRARINPADRVVILGAAGGVGIHLVQMARLFGARVWGVDVGAAKLPHVLDCGAEGAVDFRETPPAAMQALTGGATVVVDFVGRPETLAWAQQVLAPGGVLVLLTAFPGVTTPVSPREMVIKEQSIIGSRLGSHYELELAIDLVDRGRIKPVITATATLDQVEGLHDRLRAGTLVGRGVMVTDPEVR